MGYLGENFICLTVNRSGTFQVAEEARREGRVGGGQHWRPYRRCSVLGIHASLVVDGDVVTSSVNAYFTYRLLLTFLVVFFFPHLFPSSFLFWRQTQLPHEFKMVDPSNTIQGWRMRNAPALDAVRNLSHKVTRTRLCCVLPHPSLPSSFF